MGEKLLYTTNTYILKLLLNIVTAGTELLVVSGNKFLYVCVKHVCACELSQVSTHSVNSSLLLKPKIRGDYFPNSPSIYFTFQVKFWLFYSRS
jgi:hypothetical protein